MRSEGSGRKDQVNTLLLTIDPAGMARGKVGEVVDPAVDDEPQVVGLIVRRDLVRQHFSRHVGSLLGK